MAAVDWCAILRVLGHNRYVSKELALFLHPLDRGASAISAGRSLRRPLSHLRMDRTFFAFFRDAFIQEEACGHGCCFSWFLVGKNGRVELEYRPDGWRVLEGRLKGSDVVFNDMVTFQKARKDIELRKKTQRFRWYTQHTPASGMPHFPKSGPASTYEQAEKDALCSFQQQIGTHHGPVVFNTEYIKNEPTYQVVVNALIWQGNKIGECSIFGPGVPHIVNSPATL